MTKTAVFSQFGKVSDAVQSMVLAVSDYHEGKKKAVREAEIPLREAVEEVVAEIQRQFPDAKLAFNVNHVGGYQLNVYHDGSSGEIKDLAKSVLAKHPVRLLVCAFEKKLAAA